MAELTPADSLIISRTADEAGGKRYLNPADLGQIYAALDIEQTYRTLCSSLEVFNIPFQAYQNYDDQGGRKYVIIVNAVQQIVQEAKNIIVGKVIPWGRVKLQDYLKQ